MAVFSGSPRGSRPRRPAPPAGRSAAAPAALRTARLALSAVCAADLEEFFQLHHDERVYRHAPLARHPDREHSASVIDEIAADWRRDALGYWSVRDPSTSAYLGVGGVRRSGHLDRSGRYRPDGDWNVYYRFRPQAWGNGYACELVRAAASCCAELDAHAVLTARIRPVNTASRRVAERLGMTLARAGLDVSGEPQLVYEAAATDVARGPVDPPPRSSAGL